MHIYISIYVCIHVCIYIYTHYVIFGALDPGPGKTVIRACDAAGFRHPQLVELREGSLGKAGNQRCLPGPAYFGCFRGYRQGSPGRDIDIDIDIEVDVDIDSYFGC